MIFYNSVDLFTLKILRSDYIGLRPQLKKTRTISVHMSEARKSREILFYQNRNFQTKLRTI